jgi:hypothetical protein
MFPQTQAAAQGNQFSRDATNTDFPTGLMPTNSLTGLNVAFFYARVQLSSHDKGIGGKYETRLCVAKRIKGDKSTIATRYISEDEAMRQFPAQFTAFKQGEDIPADGTPLHELPGISQSQIGLLVVHGLRTVEDVAELDHSTANRIGIEALAAHKLAKSWVERRKSDAPLIAAAESEAKHEAERNADKARIAQLEARVAALQELHTIAPQVMAAAPAAMQGGAPVSVGDAEYVIPSDIPSGETEASTDIAQGGRPDPWDQ